MDSIETLEDAVEIFRDMIPENLSPADRKIFANAFFAGLVSGVGVTANRLSSVPQRDSINDYLQSLGQEIAVIVTDVIKEQAKFEGDPYGVD
jgi:hypothetical protein